MSLGVWIKRTISDMLGLGCYRWYQSQEQDLCVSKDVWAPKGVDCKIPHFGWEKQMLSYKGPNTLSIRQV